jgi:hypothetical protein
VGLKRLLGRQARLQSTLRLTKYTLYKILTLAALTLAPLFVAAQAQDDKDQDGIPDGWETNGFVSITMPDGKVQKLDLTKDGPISSDHKDIFVWVAWMEDSKHTHKPDARAMQIVRDAFARAPVANPDGTSGIRLHIYYSATSTREVPLLGSVDKNGNYNWADFNAIKKLVFPKELAGVFHFCLFCARHRLRTPQWHLERHWWLRFHRFARRFRIQWPCGGSAKPSRDLYARVGAQP